MHRLYVDTMLFYIEAWASSDFGTHVDPGTNPYTGWLYYIFTEGRKYKL